MDHPARPRVAEIIVSRAGQEPTRGSGYLVCPGWVLTAHHVIRDAASVGVWLGAPAELVPAAGTGVDVGRVLTLPAADLALLPMGGPPDDQVGEPALLGRLDRDPGAPVPAAAAGCPRFKVRPAPGRPGVLLRELEYAIGSIAALSDAKTGTYEFAVMPVPGEDLEPGKHSPWEGMSGAAVWASGRLIGIVGQHYPRQGLATLTVRPIEQLFSYASEAGLKAWRSALPQLPASAQELWLATPPAARKIEVARARRAAEALAPVVLIGRSAELAALADFAGSDMRWRWIQGSAFAGKTALLAWFALHPPDRVDVVACFLRRTTGDNTADYALDVLTRQLGLLAGWRGYLPSQFLSERANDLVDLLDEAARACAERGRRLLVLVDGLDEYDAASARLDLAAWLPDAGSLPGQAMLLAASRTGADVHLPPAHPLRSHLQQITAAEAATEIRQTARAELDRALNPGGFASRLVCCLAVAGGGLTSSELRAFLKRRGVDADFYEIDALLGSSLGRSLIRLPDPDGATGPDAESTGTQVYVFAHDTLLTEARVLVAADLATYEELLDAWAEEYVRRDWPADTPRYLLRRYTRELARRARDPAIPGSRCRAAVDQLFMVAARRSRWLWLFEQTGNPALPDQEIVTAQQAIADTRGRSGLHPDELAFRLAVLALRRRPVAGGRAGIARIAATVWARAGRVNAAVDLAAAIDDSVLRAEALSEVAAVQAGAEIALQFMPLLSDPWQRAAVLSTAAALAGAGQAGDVAGRALQAVAGIDDPERRAVVLTGVAAALAEAGQDQMVLDAAAEIDKERRAATLTKAGQAAEAAGQALQDAAAADDPGPRAEMLSSAAAALAEAGQAEQAAAAAEQALQDAAAIDRPELAADTLSRIATVLAWAGQAGQAAAAAEQALQTAAGIDDPLTQSVALSRVAAALADTGQAEQAARVAGQALQTAAAIDDREWQLEALSWMAPVLARAGQAEQAAAAAGQVLQAVAAMDDPMHRVVMLGVTAEALIAAGWATEVAAQMLQTAAVIDDPALAIQALAGVTAALAKAGQAEQAADIAERAVRLADGVDDPQERVLALAELARALAEAGQAARAAGAAGLALEAVFGFDDPPQRFLALAAVAAMLAKAGQAEQAAEVAGRTLQAAVGVDDPAQRAWALSRVVAALAETGQAGDVAGQALQAAADIDDPQQRSQALSRLAASLAETGQAEQAGDVAGQALQAAAGIDDPEQRAAALSGMAAALAGAGQAEWAGDLAGQALQAAAGIKDREQRVLALAEMATLAQTGQRAQAADAAEQALRAAAGIKNRERRAWALSGAAAALAEAGQAGRAGEVAGQVLQAVVGINDQETRAWALSWVAAALGRAGQAEQATDIARQALQAAASITDQERRAKDALHWMSGDQNRRARVLTGVVAVLAKAGQAEQALQAAAGIDDPNWRALALTAFLPDPAAGSSDPEVGGRALELLLLTSNAPEFLTAFPVALLHQLVISGEL